MKNAALVELSIADVIDQFKKSEYALSHEIYNQVMEKYYGDARVISHMNAV